MAETNASPQRPKNSASDGSWSLSLGRVSGIPIRLHFTFFLLLAWFAVRDTGPNRWYGVLYVVAIFACVLLHELGHSVTAQRYDIQVRDIVLYPIGGVAMLERMPKPRQELWIALAGPLVNVVIALGLYIGLTISQSLVPWQELAVGGGNFWQKILLANVSLAVFNMIPAFPMDGGRVLRAALAIKLGEVRATELAATVGQALAVLLGFAGLMYGQWTLLFIAFFVYIGAGQEAGMYRNKALVEGIAAREAMITDYHTLPVGATLKEASDLLLHTPQQDFPVVYGEEIVGLLSRQALLRGISEHGPTGYVAGAMTRNVLEVGPDTDLQEVATEMQAGQHICVLVKEEGRLLGLITMENLAELLVVRQLLQRSAPAEP